MSQPHSRASSPIYNGLVAVILTAFVCAAALFAFPATARADYAMPPVEDIFDREDLAVIDVTITEYDGDDAVIEVHDVMLGDFSASSLHNVVYTCFGGSLLNYGVEPGRYVIFILNENQMLEETSYFPVLEDGKVKVGWFYGQWLGIDEVVTRDELEDRLHELGA